MSNLQALQEEHHCAEPYVKTFAVKHSFGLAPSPMAIQPRRSEERSAAALAVMLTSPEPPFSTELTVTENISSRGARVVSKGLWGESNSLVIKSLEGGLQSEARVIYRRPIRDDVYAIGLELIAPRGDWREK